MGRSFWVTRALKSRELSGWWSVGYVTTEDAQRRTVADFAEGEGATSQGVWWSLDKGKERDFTPKTQRGTQLSRHLDIDPLRAPC